jgi:NAD(P)-dependent dehydrogenase (short-subunit alcohol dehydrogenase family)
VNSAGDSTRGTLESTSIELWDRLFAINVRAPFILIQESVRVMRREKIQGSIVNIITMASYGGDELHTPYAPSKAALVVLTKNVAHQLQPEHIRVNGLNIGWTDTPGEHKLRKSLGESEDWVDRAYASSPFGRMLKPEDVAPMVTFLLSDVSCMVTGSVMDYDQTVNGPVGEHMPQTFP